MKLITRLSLVAIGVTALAGVVLAQGSANDERVASSRLESGRLFSRQGNYPEALKDFTAVAETFPNTSVADDALLEIAKYYLDIALNLTEANKAVDALLKKYPSSDSVPDATVIAGRLALARSHSQADLDAAIANFDRVTRVFPGSPAVPRSLQQTAEARWLGKKYDEALGNLVKVEADYSTDPAAADAYLSSSRVQVSLGNPIGALEDLQQVRNRWPNTPEAAQALARATLVHRLYVRVPASPAYALSAETLGPPKLENVIGLAMTTGKALFYATDAQVGLVSGKADVPNTAVKPRGLTLDAAGNLVILDSGYIHPIATGSQPFMLPKQGGQPEPVKVETAIQLSGGDWLVSDGDAKAIYRFKKDGTYVNVFAANKVSRLAVNVMDEVAAIENDPKGIVVFDPSGRIITRIPAKTTAYELKDMIDVTFDAFGHLYLLDKTDIAVFSPYPGPKPSAAPAAAAPAAAAPAAAAAPGWRLLTLFTEPEKSTTGFKKATAFAVDEAGTVFLYDDQAKRVMVYR